MISSRPLPPLPAALQLPAAMRSLAMPAPAPVDQVPKEVDLHWLEGTPVASNGATWGVPWPRGVFRPAQSFALTTSVGEAVPVQSWPLAMWPDGSLKWSAHTIGAATGLAEKLVLSAGDPAAPKSAVTVQDKADAVTVSTGVVTCVIPKKGHTLIASVSRDGKEILKNGRLVCLWQNAPRLSSGQALEQKSFDGVLHQVTVEQSGPVRAVVKLDGLHQSGDREWLPFSVRLYFSAGSEAIRLMHTITFDGEQTKDFVSGFGVRFEVPLRDAPYDRHVRFVGEGKGMWGEAILNFTGLRRDAGRPIYDAQFNGTACPPVGQFPAALQAHWKEVAQWNDFTLFQATADSFEIRKRTGDWGCWLHNGFGKRAAGVGYLGGVTGGVAFGMRDFWKKHPAQIDIRNAVSDTGKVTLWLWAPDAPAMDMRHYDTKGHGLDLAYEDYEEGFATPVGIARTSELMLWALAATPARDQLLQLSDSLQLPPQVVCAPARYNALALFGGLWNLPDRSTPVKAKLEDHLDWLFALYQKEVEQRRWYGFWNYGDIMHTYDAERHTWRYDVGGFGWDNSELSPDLWLWFSFLRSGRADLYRFAEALTRHTGEVDVHHLGPYAGLGSRHNVVHWGDSAKQVRVSLSEYRRMFYYLTADERIGDLMRLTLDSDYKLIEINPVRKLPNQPPNPYPANASFGPDWFAFASNWLTEWERTGNTKYRDKIITGMKCLGAMPHGLFSGERFGYDPKTGMLYNLNGENLSVSHLSCVFGGIEVAAELISLLDVPEFEKVWLQYAELYSAPADEQTKVFGHKLKLNVLTTAHSRMTAYAAWKKGDPKLAERAWHEFMEADKKNDQAHRDQLLKKVEGPAVLETLEEVPWISTNDTAQWSLAAIQCLALAGDHIPANSPWG
ncbi:MAG: hypothetical protein QM796_00950 [Chthoniobacteraceae bacterium]